MNIEVKDTRDTKEAEDCNIDFLSSNESDDDSDIIITKNIKKNATNGIDVTKNIKNNKKNIIKNINILSPDSESDSNNSDDNLNGWDDNATITINNWYSLFKQQSFIYQWVLERNKKISNKLMLISIISSSILGIFSSFKLWINNDKFNTTSDILLMLSNFSISLITGYSKSYIDDKRNELIKIYIDEVDELLGELSAQIINSPKYRVNAEQFFRDHNYKYTKLITHNPNISIYELNESKKEYDEFMKHYNNVL